VTKRILSRPPTGATQSEGPISVHADRHRRAFGKEHGRARSIELDRAHGVTLVAARCHRAGDPLSLYIAPLGRPSPVRPLLTVGIDRNALVPVRRRHAGCTAVDPSTTARVIGLGYAVPCAPGAEWVSMLSPLAQFMDRCAAGLRRLTLHTRVTGGRAAWRSLFDNLPPSLWHLDTGNIRTERLVPVHTFTWCTATMRMTRTGGPTRGWRDPPLCRTST
jgi:hypothetical protein